MTLRDHLARSGPVVAICIAIAVLVTIVGAGGAASSAGTRPPASPSVAIAGVTSDPAASPTPDGTAYAQIALRATVQATPEPSAAPAPTPTHAAAPKPTPRPAPKPAPKPVVRALRPYPAAPARFVALGDSITLQGWPELLARADGRLRFVRNAGITGNTTTQMLARLRTDVLAYRPKLVTIEGGTNDIAHGMSAARTIANLRAMIDLVEAHGGEVVLVTIPPITPSWGHSKVLPLNAAIRALGREKHVLVADVMPWLSYPGTANWRAGLVVSDGIHPSTAGRQRIAQAVRAALLKVGL